MWFNNIIIFSYEAPIALSETDLKEAFYEHRLRACPAHAKSSIGFTPVIAQDKETLCHLVSEAYTGSLTESQRLLPASVLKAALEEKKEQFEQTSHRAMTRSEVLQAKENLEFDLLPKAFTIDRKSWFYIDRQKQWVVVNASQLSKASDVLSHIIKVTGSQGYTPLSFHESLPLVLQTWLQDEMAMGSKFRLGKQCQLIHSEEDKSTYNCKDIENHHPEIQNFLERGFKTTWLELIWDEKLSFCLTDKGAIKKVKCLDSLNESIKENADLESVWAQFDADMALLIGEVRGLIVDLLEAMNQTDEVSITTQKVMTSDNVTAVAS